MKGVLEGVKIIDFSRVLAGPYATMLLADHGAEVIKIERLDGGDDSRSFAPFVEGKSAYFSSINRNKKSVTLDLKSNEALEKVMDLLEDADVLVENFRPGVMKRLGLDYDSLKDKFPKLIYASASGYGQFGELSNRPAYDAIIQASSGLMSITGKSSDDYTKVGTSISDISTGMFTALGIMMALYRRQITGFGERIDVAMLDSTVALLESAFARFKASDIAPVPLGNDHPSIAPFGDFKTNDGSVMIACGNDRLFSSLCQCLALENLALDNDYKTNADRIIRREELKDIIESKLKYKSSDYWVDILSGRGIPVSKILNIKEVTELNHLKDRDMFKTIGDDTLIVGTPIKFNNMKDNWSPAPSLGEHNNV
ncbi:CoA transferase [Acidaminobacter sp. JC074]|uniref:CaiB/BaiF CoA transferase family protein n=1 Tax=Acidaminobacter sp. JC074 TaxID=2530199 RepID=UPI001F0E706B|nr:CaiB/BaiF CoA-transferase family protein [Acidaminobacter sp. JC074]MCH4886309.1 CoA transferase [Acidaminobacter sp. JC074]